MKVTFLSLILFLSIMGCKENTNNDLETEVIKVTLEGTEPYQYEIADAIPTEGGYEIRKQANNYQISEMNWGTYNFQAKEGFRGSETVEIFLSTSIGDDNFTDQKKWVFEIKVK
ncbi:hypothetical protein ABWH96_07170 [Marivirga tractuosa]|uniref:hypothetical protein n=1 Tax=Marivirga tractuosa TaxID=1006 RepID=UPI0035D13418